MTVAEGTLPPRARELCEAATDDWLVDVDWDETPVPGSTRSVSLGFTHLLKSGRCFMFVTRWAVSERTGRWQSLQLDGSYRVLGALQPGNGSTRDEVARMIGTALETRFWKTLKSLNWWLKNPQKIAELDWVQDELAPKPPPACVCGLGEDHPDCYCEGCVHKDCQTTLGESDKEMGYTEDGQEVWPLCGEHILLYYDADGEPLAGEQA